MKDKSYANEKVEIWDDSSGIPSQEVDYQAIFERTPVGVYLADADGRIIECNKAFADMYGFDDPKELKGFDVRNFWLPVESWKKFYEKLRNTKKVVGHIGQNVKKDGEIFYISISSQANYDMNGKFIGRQGTVMDVTQNVESAAYLTSKDEELERILRELPQAVITLDENLNVLKVSRGLPGFVNKGEVDNSNLMWLLDNIKGRLRNDALKGKSIENEAVFERRGELREEISLVYTAVRVDNGEKPQIILLVNYSTGIPYIIRQAIDHVSEGVLVTDLRGMILYANKAMADIHGYESPEEFIGRDAVIFNPHPENGPRIPGLQEIEESGSDVYYKWTGEMDNRRKQGDVVPILLTLSYIKDKDGKNIGRIGTAKDIRKMKRIQEEKLEAEKLGELAYVSGKLAHTIKNPIQNILGAKDAIDRETNIDVIRKKWGLMIEKKAKAVVSLLRPLSEVIATQKEIVKINDVLTKCVERVKRKCDRLDIKIVHSFADIPSIMANPNELEMLFDSLIDNAIKAIRAKKMDKTGEIGIITSGDDHVYIQITDNGIGIKDDDLSNIFRPFYRTDKFKELGGIGLGLYISKRIVNSHGGEIFAESTVGKGTTITTKFPAERGDSK